MINVTYQGTGKIFDTRLNELQLYSNAFTYIDKNFPEMTVQQKQAIQSIGLISNLFILLTIGITSFIGLK